MLNKINNSKVFNNNYMTGNTIFRKNKEADKYVGYIVLTSL